MDTSEWLTLWQEPILRRYFAALARACSHDERILRDLIGTAWLAIGECLPDISLEWAMHVGYKAMIDRYKDRYRPRRKRWRSDPVRWRAFRVRRRFFIKRTPTPPACGTIGSTASSPSSFGPGPVLPRTGPSYSGG